jgi:hypothetical protein
MVDTVLIHEGYMLRNEWRCGRKEAKTIRFLWFTKKKLIIMRRDKMRFRKWIDTSTIGAWKIKDSKVKTAHWAIGGKKYPWGERWQCGVRPLRGWWLFGNVRQFVALAFGRGSSSAGFFVRLRMLRQFRCCSAR